MILSALQEYVRRQATCRTVVDVRVGLCYTAVLLDNGVAGVALTFGRDIPPGCAVRNEYLAGTPAAEIIAGMTASDLLVKTVGIATANALLNAGVPELARGDTLDMLAPDSDDVVGMVGYFGPLIPRLKHAVKKLYVFERGDGSSPEAFPCDSACQLLPECSIALITSSTLINGTLEPLLEAARGCRHVVLVGASTPLAGEVFAPRGVTLLSGVLIDDPGALLRAVSEGGGMKRFRKYLTKVNLQLS